MHINSVLVAWKLSGLKVNYLKSKMLAPNFLVVHSVAPVNMHVAIRTSRQVIVSYTQRVHHSNEWGLIK